MPRCARRKADSGFYHVVMRGSGQQVLFEDNRDREAFLAFLQEACALHGVRIIAWCLMDNHVHLLLEDPDDGLSDAMRSVATSYAQRFNSRWGHVGHVFQQRFKSSPIESDAYLLQAVRYIHDNPAKAGICPAAEYWWSSYHEYVGEPRIATTTLVLDALGGVEGFVTFSSGSEPNPYRFMQMTRVPDSMAREVASRVLGQLDPMDLKGVEIDRRNQLLFDLREQGLSVRQIVRLTGLGKNVIDRATR